MTEAEPPPPHSHGVARSLAGTSAPRCRLSHYHWGQDMSFYITLRTGQAGYYQSPSLTEPFPAIRPATCPPSPRHTWACLHRRRLAKVTRSQPPQTGTVWKT